MTHQVQIDGLSHSGDENRPLRIALRRNGQHIWNSHPLQQLDLVNVRRLVATGDDCHGYDVRQERESLLISPDGFRIPNVGCVMMLQSLAASRGVHLEVHASPRISQLPEPANEACLDYHKLAEFVRKNENGLIRVPKSFEPSDIIFELSLAYPNKHIVVLAGKTAPLERIANRLWTSCSSLDDPREIEFTHASRPLNLGIDQYGPRIVCSTFTEAGNLDFATSDILILLDAYECVQSRAQVALEQMDARFRLYGIVRAHRRVSPYEEGVTMGVFGPELIDLMKHGRTRRQVQVGWVHHRQPTIKLERQGSDFDYKCVFHNERRNRVIAKLAKSLAAGAKVDRTKFGDVALWCEGVGRRPYSVTVLVDRVDHAAALAKQLRDWPIVTGKNVSLYGYPGSVRKLFKRTTASPWEFGRNQIVLSDAADSFPGYGADVIIWAGSGPCAPPIPAFWMAEKSHSDRPLLIVDFLDPFNEQTREWGRLREMEYAERDLFGVGVDASLGRSKRFFDLAIGES